MTVKQLIPSLVLPIPGQNIDKVRERGGGAFGREQHNDADLMQVVDFSGLMQVCRQVP